MNPRQISGLTNALEADGYAHGFGWSDTETGGVLVGQIRGKGPPHVEACIRAVASDEQSEMGIFSHSSWNRIHSEIDRRYPGRQIVGWYATHSAHGLDLSERDRYIHSNFFQHPGQIVVIIDPVAAQEAIYRWDGTRLVEHMRSNCNYAAWETPAPVSVNQSPTAVIRVERRVSLPRRLARPPLRTESYVYLAAIAVSLGVIIWELLFR